MVQATVIALFSLSPERAGEVEQRPGREPKPTSARPARRMLDQDAELIARIRNGATDEYAEIVQRHHARVFSILYRYERDHQKLEDLAQETFIKAWRALERFDGRAPFEHWLARIATRVALDHLRKQHRHRAEIRLEELGE